MKNFIIHNNIEVINRIISNNPLPVDTGTTIREAAGKWDVPIGTKIVKGAPVVCPSKDHVWNGSEYVLPDDVAAALEQKQIEADRQTALISERAASGMQGITVDKAREIIAKKYDAVRAIQDPAARLDALIDACQWIDEKMIPFIL